MIIPTQLQKAEYRFIKLKTKDKIPIETDWKKINNYNFDDDELNKHITKGGNYGIIGGYGNLIIIDCDQSEVVHDVEEHLPQTFTIKTGRGGKHFYYKCYDIKGPIRLKDNHFGDIGDVQTYGKQVVGPNCTHPTGTKYEIDKDFPIATIDEEQILHALRKYIVQKNRVEDETQNKDNIDLKISNVIDISKLTKRGHEYQGAHPLHGSTGGLNFTVDLNKNTWHCFRHQSGGGPMAWIAIKHGIISCEEATSGNLKGDKFKQALEIAYSNYGLKRPESPFKFEDAAHQFLPMQQVAKFIKKQPIFYDEHKHWWVWNFKQYRWQMVDDTTILNYMYRIFSNINIVESKTRTEITNALKQIGRLNRPQDSPKTWVQFHNKIIDIKTGEEIEPDPKYFITNPIPWELGDSEETPNIDRLFGEWVDKKYVKTLQEILAFGILPDYALHRIFCLVGEGRNGKTTFIHVGEKFWGEHNGCTTSLDRLISGRFESAKLFRKLYCRMGEINSTVFKKTELLKALVGTDSIPFEFKGKDGFDDYNYAKLVIATNRLPQTTDKAKGFYSKWCIIDFDNTFEENPHLLDCVPNEEYRNLARKSIRLLKELLDRGTFTNEGNYEEREERYETRSSPINKFIKNQCIIDPNEKCSFNILQKHYNSYLGEIGDREISAITFGRLLKANGFKDKIREKFERPDGTISSRVVMLGINLRDLVEERQETEGSSND